MSLKLNTKLEQFGHILFERIRIQFFILVVAIPPLFAALYIWEKKQDLADVQVRFSQAMKKGKASLERKMRKDRFLERHALPTPYFLDTEIEALTFLNQEKERLKCWLAHPAISKKELLLERLQFLEGEGNRLSFIEEEIQQSDLWKETVEKQRHSVEIDNEDLKKLLTLIEDIPISGNLSKAQRPQLLITDFSLTKTASPLQNEVFEVNIDLLKREFQ